MHWHNNVNLLIFYNTSIGIIRVFTSRIVVHPINLPKYAQSIYWELNELEIYKKRKASNFH